MSVNKLEALLDAIAHLKGYSTNPDSTLYQIRNPLGIISFSRPGKNEIDDEGRRIFSSDLAGRRACLFDLELKVKGESRAGIKPEDKLENLLRVYGVSELLGQQQVVKFLKRALKDETISRTTPLAYFLL
jgi:hypothetical protein